VAQLLSVFFAGVFIGACAYVSYDIVKWKNWHKLLKDEGTHTISDEI